MARKRRAKPAAGEFRENPAIEPSPVPETGIPASAEVRPMGGMVEKRWSGIPMWECPRCRGTTFDPKQAVVHTCKEVRYADEEFTG